MAGTMGRKKCYLRKQRVGGRLQKRRGHLWVLLMDSTDTQKGNLGHICERSQSPKILSSARCLHQPQGNLFALQDRA